MTDRRDKLVQQEALNAQRLDNKCCRRTRKRNKRVVIKAVRADVKKRIRKDDA